MPGSTLKIYIYLKGTKSHLPCAFGGAHAEKKKTPQKHEDAGTYSFSYYTTSYTTTCVTFIDRFTI